MAWSYTSLSAFENCPLRYYRTRVEKAYPEPQSTEMVWGNQVHQALEQRLRDATPLPELLHTYEPYAGRIAAMRGTLAVERKVAVTANYQETDWFAPDVWCRGIFDVVIDQGERVLVLDWKTGKRKPESNQLELFAALASIVFPNAVVFDTMFIWLKHEATDMTRYTKRDIPLIWSKFTQRAKHIDDALATKEFPAKPSGLCRRYCPVKSCSFCGR